MAAYAADMAAETTSARAQEILAIAVDLFANRGYHGVSMDDIGAAAGVTGPALYHHFAGKEAMLTAAITPVSERLLAQARAIVAAADTPRGALAALIDFHVGFALDQPAVITVQRHELDRLPADHQARIRRLQRAYVEEWAGVLRRLHPGVPAATARAAAHAAFGLMNSTPFLGHELARDDLGALLRRMTTAALVRMVPNDR